MRCCCAWLRMAVKNVLAIWTYIDGTLPEAPSAPKNPFVCGKRRKEINDVALRKSSVTTPSINQSIDRSINQSIDQSTERSINQSMENQPTIRPFRLSKIFFFYQNSTVALEKTYSRWSHEDIVGRLGLRKYQLAIGTGQIEISRREMDGCAGRNGR